MTTKEKKRERTKKWKQDNREKINSYNRKYRVENNLEVTRKKQKRDKKAYFVALAGGKCIKCGYSDCVGALQFHHINPDEKTIGRRTLIQLSMDKALEEIKKCILLCANCHAELHYNLE